MTQESIEQVLDLQEEGNTPEEIMEITGLALEEIESITEDLEEEPEEPTTLSGIDKANNLKERELNYLEKQEFLQSEKQKRKTLKEFKALAEGLLDHCQGSTWDRDAIKKSYTEIEELIENVEEVFGFDTTAMEDNSAYEILVVLKEQFAGLSKQDPDYKVTIDWSIEKIELLQYGMAIEKFDDSDWDREDFNRQRAHNIYTRFLEELADDDNRKVDADDLEELQSKLSYAKESLSSDLPGVDGEFDEELEVLESIGSYFDELAIRIDESFWGEKRIQLPESIQELMTEVEEDE